MHNSTSNQPNESKAQTAANVNRRLMFDDFVFYPLEQRLTYHGETCPLEPKMLQLLMLLIDARPAVLSKQLLMERLWPDAVVSDWSLARLVSDTRKLIDNDQQRSLIKTVRGKGFCFDSQVDEIIEAYPANDDSSVAKSAGGSADVVNSTNSGYRLRRLFGFMVVAIIVVLLAFNRFTPTNVPTSLNHDSQQHRLEVMFEIQKNLRLTKTAYLTQVRRRQELKASLIKKIPEPTPLTSEKRIQLHYANLSNNERFIFDQIRALTEGPIYQGNTAILKLLDEHPEVYREIELFVTLYNHLNIWKNKYHRVFENRPEMAFVFVGEEDGLPFPSEIDGLVDDWVAENNLISE
jgi:DNA-binding winged helix-turn-helix (wHTH) protein